MRMNGPILRQNIRPANHTPFRERDKLNVVTSHVAHYECAGILKRRSFEERQILVLARDHVEHAMEFLDVLGGDGENGNVHTRLLFRLLIQITNPRAMHKNSRVTL
jgi:hypothetical protein